MPANELHIDPHYSASVDDIIGVVPGRFLYSGITMIALVTITVIAMSYFIKYPDKIKGVGFLTAESPPIEVICQADGMIDTIFQENNSTIKAGEPILFIKSMTEANEVDKLVSWTRAYENTSSINQFLKLKFPVGLQLGEVQMHYADLQILVSQLQEVLRNNLVNEHLTQMDREVAKINALSASSKKEIELFGQELELEKKNYDRQKKLLKEGVISQSTFENMQTGLLQKQRASENLTNSLIQNDIRVEQLNLQKIILQNEHKTEIKNYRFRINELITKTKSIIGSWSYSYQVESPISGQLNFLKGVVPKRNMVAGQQIAYILPSERKSQYMQVGIPISNAGKIEKGLKAIIKFDAFPHKEFGSVLAKVSAISKLPEVNENGEALYEVKITLPQKIETDYGREIPYKPQMSGSVEIITADKSILERILAQFLSLVK